VRAFNLGWGSLIGLRQRLVRGRREDGGVDRKNPLSEADRVQCQGTGDTGCRPTRTLGSERLFVITDAAAQIADLGYEAHFLKGWREGPRLWKHVARHLSDFTFRFLRSGADPPVGGRAKIENGYAQSVQQALSARSGGGLAAAWARGVQASAARVAGGVFEGLRNASAAGDEVGSIPAASRR
jgi:hypothetical protein